MSPRLSSPRPRERGRPLRIVHCADVHLDTPYQNRSPELRRRLGEAGRAAWRAVCGLAREVDADALVVAGDLYDEERLSLATERRLVADLERLAADGIAVVVATGNHDPGAGPRARRIAWPAGAHVFRDAEPRAVELFGRDGQPLAWIVGAGHASARETQNLASRFPQSAGALPAVAVLHTQVHDALGAGRHEAYAPSARTDFARGGYDYWALGHVHRRQRVSDEPAAWYPGNLHGRHFGEPGPKGALVVDVARGRPAAVHFQALASVRFEVLAIDVGGAQDAGELAGRVHAAFAALTARADVVPGQEWMLRLALGGETSLAPELTQAERRAELAESFAAELDVLTCELDVTGIARPLALDAQRGRPHTLGLALDLCTELAHDDALWARVVERVFAGLAEPERGRRAQALRERVRAEPERFERWIAAALLGDAQGGDGLRAEGSGR